MSWLYHRQPEGSLFRFGHAVVRESQVNRMVITAPIGLNFVYRYGERLIWRIRWFRNKERLDCPCCGQRFPRFQRPVKPPLGKRASGRPSGDP